MGIRVTWLYLVLISVINGAVAQDKLLMKSSAATSQGACVLTEGTDTSQGTCVVTEGTDVSFTCYYRDGSNALSVKWYRGSLIGTTNFSNATNNCTSAPGPIDDKVGRVVQFYCNRTSSTIVIQDVVAARRKELMCSSSGQNAKKSARIDLQVQSVPSTISTTAATTTTKTTTANPLSTPEPTHPTAATSASVIEVTNVLQTATSTHSSSFSGEQTVTTASHVHHTDGEETYNRGIHLSITLPATLGGAAATVLCVFLAWRTRTRRNLQIGSLQKRGTDSQEDILEMQENPAYWTSMQAAKTSSTKPGDPVPFVKAEMQDNPVYWSSNNATVDSIPQLKDEDEKDRPFYWTIEAGSTDHPTQTKDEDENDRPVYWTIEAGSHGPSHPDK